jgi:hypothetical protein
METINKIAMSEKIEDIDDNDEEMDFEGEFTTREEYINTCSTLLGTIEMMNPMTKEETAIKKNIIKRCYKILDVMSAEMYDELFEDREEVEEQEQKSKNKK